jgi:hypothetical protein
MTTRNVSNDGKPLPVRIALAERRLLERRRRIGSVTLGIRQKLRARLVSPGLLLAAGFGVALERSTHRKGLPLVAVLSVVGTYGRLLALVWSWVQRSPREPRTPPAEGESRG